MRLCCLSCAICIHYYGLFAFSLQTIKICSCGNIYMNNFIVKLPVSKGKCLLHIVLRLACICLKTDSCSFLWRARPCPLSDTFDLGGYKVWESLGIPVCTQCTGKREFLFTELYKDLQVHTYIFISLFFFLFRWHHHLQTLYIFYQNLELSWSTDSSANETCDAALHNGWSFLSESHIW